MKVVNDPQYSEVREIKDEEGNVIGKDTVNFLVNSVIAQVGRGTSDPGTGQVEMGATPNKGAGTGELREVHGPQRIRYQRRIGSLAKWRYGLPRW